MLTVVPQAINPTPPRPVVSGGLNTTSERHDSNVRPPAPKAGGLPDCPTLRSADYLPVCERIRVLRRLPGSTYYATSMSSCLAYPLCDLNAHCTDSKSVASAVGLRGSTPSRLLLPHTKVLSGALSASQTVPVEGLAPSRPFGHRCLRAACLRSTKPAY